MHTTVKINEVLNDLIISGVVQEEIPKVSPTVSNVAKDDEVIPTGPSELASK